MMSMTNTIHNMAFSMYAIHNYCLKRMHSSRMRTARSSSRLGGLHKGPPGAGTPLGADPPRTRHPPDQAPPGADPLQGMLGYHLQCMLG